MKCQLAGCISEKQKFTPLTLHRLIQIPDQVVGRLEADRQADDVVAGPRGDALLVGELPMGGRGRMQNQASRVADIRQMREQAHAFDQLDAGLEAAFDAEGENGARAFRQVFPRELVIGASVRLAYDTQATFG